MAIGEFHWPTPRAAYIHVPFCRHRCGYCNFSVVTNRGDLIDRYLMAIDHELSSLGKPEIDTLFIGGGTPTNLDVVALDRLLRSMNHHFRFADDLEWTVEANPEDITTQKLDLLVRHGVNRMSLGVQSFRDEKLRTLERGHDGQTVRQTIIDVAARIPNVSLDLIFAAPGESLKSWKADLVTALSLPIVHLSTYALTIEKGTSFWSRRSRGELHELSDQTEVAMYNLAREATAEAGLKHYEISSFARDGSRCRHNLSYWRGEGWYAAGPGAARFVAGKRETNHRSTTTYLKRIEHGADTIAESETITPDILAKERAAFGVRMIDGVPLDEIEAATGFDVRKICDTAMQANITEGLIKHEQGVISLTERGILFADMVAARFLD